MRKIALMGMEIPTLLPGLMADLLFAEKQPAEVALLEGNPAMQEVLRGYGESVIRRSGLEAKMTVSGELPEVLRGADAVIYADDCMPASRFAMDRQALEGENDDDPGLANQARINGGIGGLMHTLRSGSLVLDTCGELREYCPQALVINLSQPVARTTELFTRQGFRCFGLGPSPLRGSSGLDRLCERMSRKTDSVRAEIAGLPGFAFLLSLEDKKDGEDLLPQLIYRAQHGELGRLSARWLDWWGALPVGDVTAHAELLPEQEDYQPPERPQFGETVEQRKQRILDMNTVAQQGASSRDGALHQASLLSRVSPVRPMRLAMALLEEKDLEMPAVTRVNRGALPQLPASAVIEAPLTLEKGEVRAESIRLPGSLEEIMGEVAETNHLAALTAEGDRSALRECLEIDPALAGLDRLYCLDLVNSLIRLHEDVLPRWREEEE